MYFRIYFKLLLTIFLIGLVIAACSTDAESENEITTTVNERAENPGNDQNYGDDGDSQDNDTNSGNTGYGASEETGSAVTYEISNSGASAYIFNGEGFNNEENPSITLKRGSTYTFVINSPGHPFIIKTTQTTSDSDLYEEGISNNGIDTGTITFEVSADAPSVLYYICEFHASMSGVIAIED